MKKTNQQSIKDQQDKSSVENLLIKSSQLIMNDLEEGIHIVDLDGMTRVYNKAMSEIEGLKTKQVMNKHLLDIFPDWTRENSTLLTVLETKEKIENREQHYVNLKGKEITTINTTLPIFDGEKLIGAVEVSRNLTTVSNMSEQIIELQQQLIAPKPQPKAIKSYHFDELIGRNPLYVQAINLAQKAAKSLSSVLIFGETGTGKEMFAQSIHYASERSKQPFIAQNCAAIPENLLEGILFGTEKGSFTGAISRPGLFEQASGGTLFLDEINSMSLGLQAKLLRVLQESYVRRIGGSKDIPINVRIISATNESPAHLIEKGLLRKDFYYRINVIFIKIPSLNERVEDIPLLVDYFLRDYNQRLGKDVWMLSEDLMQAFKMYEWEGNIRELKNFIESAMNLVTDEHVITKEHMPSHVAEVLLEKNKYQVDELEIDDLNLYLEAIERKIIVKTLYQYDNNITKASHALNLSRQNLQYKIKKYQIV